MGNPYGDDDENWRFKTNDRKDVQLCAFCIPNLNASYLTRVIPMRGLAHDLINAEITFPNGSRIKLLGMLEIPPGGTWLTDFAFYFGHDVSFTDGNNRPVPVFAVTMRDGTYVCNEHNMMDRRRTYR